MSFVRIGSHRAGAKLDRELGREAVRHYTWETGGCLALVTDEELQRARAITGITLYRPPAGRAAPRPCWSMR